MTDINIRISDDNLDATLTVTDLQEILDSRNKVILERNAARHSRQVTQGKLGGTVKALNNMKVKLAESQAEVVQLKEALSISKQKYMTTGDYIKTTKVSYCFKLAQRLGRAVAKYCRENKINIIRKEVEDRDYKDVATYPVSILDRELKLLMHAELMKTC